MLDVRLLIPTLTVCEMRDEMERLQRSLQDLMRKHECRQVKLSCSEVDHLHRALIEADSKVEWLRGAVYAGNGDENFMEWMRHT